MAFLKEAPAPSVSKILLRCTPQRAADIVSESDSVRAAEWIEDMPAERAALVLRRLPADDTPRIVEQVSEPLKKQLKQLLSYSPDTVGAAVNLWVLTLGPDQTVAQALKAVEHSKRLEHDCLYVVDQNQHFHGIITLRDCMRSKPTGIVSIILTTVTDVFGFLSFLGLATIFISFL